MWGEMKKLLENRIFNWFMLGLVIASVVLAIVMGDLVFFVICYLLVLDCAFVTMPILFGNNRPYGDFF